MHGGRSPTQREITQGTNGASKRSVGDLIGDLKRAGLIVVEDGARGIRLPGEIYIPPAWLAQLEEVAA